MQEMAESRMILVTPHEHRGVSSHCQLNGEINSLPRLTTESNRNSASLARFEGIHQWLVDSSHKGSVRCCEYPYDIMLALSFSDNVYPDKHHMLMYKFVCLCDNTFSENCINICMHIFTFEIIATQYHSKHTNAYHTITCIRYHLKMIQMIWIIGPLNSKKSLPYFEMEPITHGQYPCNRSVVSCKWFEEKARWPCVCLWGDQVW